MTTDEVEDRLEAVVGLLEQRTAAGEQPGGWSLAASHGGRTWSVAGGSRTPDDPRAVTTATPFRLSSLTKLFAGLLATSLLADDTLRLADPVSRWLPELASPRVLAHRHGPLEATVPAREPVTVEHLLTMTAGFGGVWEPCPLSAAMWEAGVSPGPFAPDLAPEEYLRRLAALPLAAQPGERWLYHTSSDVLGLLLARVTGTDLPQLLVERVLRPLGCAGTGFSSTLLGPAWQVDEHGAVEVLDPADGRLAAPPAFPSLAAGLVAPAGDVLALLDALVDGGPVAPPAWAVRLRSPAVTPAQRGDGAGILDEGTTWGLHCGVSVAPGRPGRPPGAFGWDGGTGTTAWHDPSSGLSLVMLTARGVLGDAEFWDGLWGTSAAG